MRHVLLALTLAACSSTPALDDGGPADGGPSLCTECHTRCSGPGDAPVDCVNNATGAACPACVPTCTQGGLGVLRAACGGGPELSCLDMDGFTVPGAHAECWRR